MTAHPMRAQVPVFAGEYACLDDPAAESRLADHIPGLRQVVPDPRGRTGPAPVATIVYRLNDLGWTREAIADWLDTLPGMEVHQDPVDAPPPAEVLEAAEAAFAEAVQSAQKEGQ